MTQDGAVLGNLGREMFDNTPSLQAQPGQLWWEGELRAQGFHKEKNKKSIRENENRRKLPERYPGYFRDLVWNSKQEIVTFDFLK